MPRPKQPAGYPAVYYDVIEMVTQKHEPFIFTCESNKKAQLIRFQFYDFIKACRKSLNRREQELGEMAYGLIFSVKDNKLTISIRDMMEDAQNLRNALDGYIKTSPEKQSERNTFVSLEAKSEPTDAQEDLINLYLKGGKK